MESKLMPCICGGEDGWACWKTSDETYYLECESCGYKTKEHKTVADAETEWDKRNGAPMTTSEPTTGEIVATLRRGCLIVQRQAADRLESQEQKLKMLNGEDFDVIDVPATLAYLESVEPVLPHASALIDLIQSLKGTATELAARAEQAEKERDAAVADIESIMSLRGLKDFVMCGYCAMPDDETCFIPKNAEKCDAKWRGLPQEGEGV